MKQKSRESKFQNKSKKFENKFGIVKKRFHICKEIQSKGKAKKNPNEIKKN